VDPLGVVVGDVVSEQTSEMTFPEDDHVIEKLSSTGAYPPLGNRALPKSLFPTLGNTAGEPP
jgi:hypothetical protein